MNTKTLLSRKASVAGGPAPWLFGIVALLMLMSSPEAVFPQSTGKSEETCHPPAFPAMTYDEGNRFLSNPGCRTEFFDRLKFIPLRGSNENYYLSFGVSIRDRYIGRHAALQATLDINRNTTFFTEYLHFFTGDFLRQATAGKDVNYWTGWIEFRY